MNQLTWKQAEELASKAALQALGFGPRTGKVTVEAEEVIRVAARAAVIALREAGNLKADDAKSKAWNDQKADDAEKTQREWERKNRK